MLDGRRIVVGVRPEDFEDAALSSTAAAGRQIRATVKLVEALGSELMVHMAIDAKRVDSGDPDAPEFVPARTPLARPVVLPDAVTFRDVVLPAVGTVTEGTVFAQFSPEGWADPLVVHLRSRSGADATMAIEPLTGRTRDADRYVALEHDDDRHDDDRRDDERRGGMTGGLRRNRDAAR